MSLKITATRSLENSHSKLETTRKNKKVLNIDTPMPLKKQFKLISTCVRLRAKASKVRVLLSPVVYLICARSSVIIVYRPLGKRLSVLCQSLLRLPNTQCKSVLTTTQPNNQLIEAMCYILRTRAQNVYFFERTLRVKNWLC